MLEAIFATIVLILYILCTICFVGIDICKKHIREIDALLNAIEQGISYEELLKMPMPKKLRQELKDVLSQMKR